LHGLLGKIYSRNLRTGSREIDRIGSDAATNLQDFLAAPPFELRKKRNVRLDKIFAGLYLVEVLPRSNRRHGMPDIARLGVPIVLTREISTSLNVISYLRTKLRSSSRRLIHWGKFL